MYHLTLGKEIVHIIRKHKCNETKILKPESRKNVLCSNLFFKHQSKIWRKGCQVVANVTQSDHLSTDPGLSYECAPNGHFGKYICAHYLQALNTFLDISNYISRLFTDSKYGVNRRSGMDLERLGHWMLLEPTSHLYIVAASVRTVLGTGQYRSFRSLHRVKYRVWRIVWLCTAGGIIGLLYIMQAARGAPGIDSCSMGEWALGRGLVVVCPPMAGSCINFLKPLTQTGNQPPEHSSINQRKNWQRNNLVGRRKGCTRKFVGKYETTEILN